MEEKNLEKVFSFDLGDRCPTSKLGEISARKKGKKEKKIIIMFGMGAGKQIRYTLPECDLYGDSLSTDIPGLCLFILRVPQCLATGSFSCQVPSRYLVSVRKKTPQMMKRRHVQTSSEESQTQNVSTHRYTKPNHPDPTTETCRMQDAERETHRATEAIRQLPAQCVRSLGNAAPKRGTKDPLPLRE